MESARRDVLQSSWPATRLQDSPGAPLREHLRPLQSLLAMLLMELAKQPALLFFWHQRCDVSRDSACSRRPSMSTLHGHTEMKNA